MAALNFGTRLLETMFVFLVVPVFKSPNDSLLNQYATVLGSEYEEKRCL
jgi:hypothetical protein